MTAQDFTALTAQPIEPSTYQRSAEEFGLKESGARMLTLLLDGDRPGREATAELLPRLAARFFVRVVHLPDGAQPDTVPEQFLLKVLSTSR